MEKVRVLYVDDEIGAARQLRNNLELTGRYAVRVENWPEDAAGAAREFKPNLVLLDIIMPRMPGGNVVEEFENDPDLKPIPIVFFTAAVWRHQVEEHEGEICEHPCLAKPATVEEIIDFIEQNLPAELRAPASASVPDAPPVASPETDARLSA